MRILDRYQGHIPLLNKKDLTRFFKRSREVLPTYHRAFREAASEHQVPWQLVAAVAYQESHWNRDARSFTGVRGLMQLTEETAEHLGVDDRTDPVQSIWGGSKYLRYLLDQTPNHLNKKDRIALALAAYNIGSAHLRDAQRLAQKMGRNPYSWHDLRRVLPLLADPDYAEDLTYGAARGYETVEFVERVKSFYNLLDPEA
jgi:membrane-bound lytic murein transglycosylase F